MSQQCIPAVAAVDYLKLQLLLPFQLGQNTRKEPCSQALPPLNCSLSSCRGRAWERG